MNISKDIMFSIVVPTYNMGQYIERCLYSILDQSYKNIELICVNDGSTDKTIDILKQIKNEDKRFKYISYEGRKSANIARKMGVLTSKGDYILFCDADDYVIKDAFEILYEEIVNECDIDILHFRTLTKENDKVVLNSNNILAPYYGVLFNEDILLKCFNDHWYLFTLWNKLYSSSVVKKAFKNIEDDVILRGQDLYAYFLIAFYAKKYKGIASPPLYLYDYGKGLDGRSHYSLKEFCDFLYYNKTIKNIRDFLFKVNKINEYKTVIDKIEVSMIKQCINRLALIDEGDRARAIREIDKRFNSDIVRYLLLHKYKIDPQVLIRILCNR